MNVKFRALFSVLLLAAASALSLPAQETLRIATFNNQYENKVHPWADRADRVYRLIEAENWDIVGMQEPFWNQVADMDAKLTQYGWIGNSTDGKIEDGYWHYNPIFYRKAAILPAAAYGATSGTGSAAGISIISTSTMTTRARPPAGRVPACCLRASLPLRPASHISSPVTSTLKRGPRHTTSSWTPA